jgi:hypothetical protein
MSKQFNEFRFGGLNYRSFSNKYYTMNRVSDDDSKIVVKVADDHIMPTRYGFALILDASHVVFLKEWAVSCNDYGNEVLLSREFFNVKTWGDFSENFMDEPENCTWEHYYSVAKVQQDANNMVKWAK